MKWPTAGKFLHKGSFQGTNAALPAPTSPARRLLQSTNIPPSFKAFLVSLALKSQGKHQRVIAAPDFACFKLGACCDI